MMVTGLNTSLFHFLTCKSNATLDYNGDGKQKQSVLPMDR